MARVALGGKVGRGAINIHLLRWRGGGANGKDSKPFVMLNIIIGK